MVDNAIAGVIRQYLAVLPSIGIHARTGVLFGSLAREAGDEWSDIDLVVIAPEFDGPRDVSTVKRLWRARGVDSRIEPIPCGEQEWETDGGRPILEIARREGVVIEAECSRPETGVRISIPQDRIQVFCRRHQIRRLALYGSVLREDFAPDSDVDVLAEFEPGRAPGLMGLVRIQDELSEILGREVDLAERESVEKSENYIRRRHILESLETIYVA